MYDLKPPAIHLTASLNPGLRKTFAALLLYCLFIILWGAWVRISGSGDGCGAHWPFCHGEIIPEYRGIAMLIENFHRISSKALGLFIIGLCFYVFRKFSKPHPLRKRVIAVLVITIIEGLLGAVLVKFGFVGKDDSVGRGVVMALHLINTFLLTASITLCWAELKYPSLFRPKLMLPKSIKYSAIALLILWMIVNSFGALAALASTLFPSTSLIEGFQKDLASDSHYSLKLRFLHPVFAVSFILLCFYFLQSLKSKVIETWQVKALTISQIFIGLNLFAGLITLGLLSPTYMKLMHLTFTHVIWISLSVSVLPFFIKRTY